MPRKLLLSIVVLATVLLLPLLAQQRTDGNSSAIQQAVDAGNFRRADSLIKQDIRQFLQSKQPDSLIAYIELAGIVNKKLNGTDKTVAAVLGLIDSMKTGNASAGSLLEAHYKAADFFGREGLNQQSYTTLLTALPYAALLPQSSALETAHCEYNLGSYAHRLGNVSLSQSHYRRALAIRESTPGVNAEDLYLSYNSFGNIMWYSSKYDSATFFYNKSLEALAKMPDNDLNRYYRPANTQNNLAALYSAEGKTSEAITAMQKTIENFQAFLASKEPHPKKADAQAGLFQAIDNLAGIYREIGDYSKGGELLLYAYQQKKQKLSPDQPDIFISEILLGQHYNSINEYDKALQYSLSGLEKLEKAEGDYLFWKADATYTLALVYENIDKPDKAAEYYLQSEVLYDECFEGEFDNIYMDFARNASLFYARHNMYPRAISSARKVYDYLAKVGEEKSLQGFYQLLNIAEVEYLSKNYQQAIRYSDKALNILYNTVTEGSTVLDSAKIEIFKPKAILVNAKAGYALQSQKDTAYLKKVAARLNEALQTLEKRKVLIDDPGNINLLISSNAELIEFAKKIELELYQLSGNDSYLDQMINLHESGLYNRIRSNLDKEKAIRFANLPEDVQNEEQQLKQAVRLSLHTGKPNKELINDYLQAEKNWEAHLEKVKTSYPLYYNMRYGSVFKSLPELQSTIPSHTTLIRYFFSDSSLYALVADSNHKKLVQLNNNHLDKAISSLLYNNKSEKEQTQLLNGLYNTLWLPIRNDVQTQKVMIIPDGILFSLSFEMLTAEPVQSFNEVAAKSLLSKHTISYHYSLFMLDEQGIEREIDKNYIAFIPVFSDEAKKEYVSLVKDSVRLDYQYLSLLPQPNTYKLARKIGDQLEGKLFTNSASTQKSFIQNASGYKIVHVGTHAEYNNNNPERSRLIFSKNMHQVEDTNSLYLSDIYNCRIHSELTVLTACESGRPGYHDGEGMISLAHAFNYAGSKSILTGLWKLDEQSSNMITGFFIQNLIDKMPTDEALRQAKLRYLSTAEGRMKAPAYWAGIALMGKPGVIQLEKPSPGISLLLYTTGTVILLIIAVVLIRRKKKARGPGRQ